MMQGDAWKFGDIRLLTKLCFRCRNLGCAVFTNLLALSGGQVILQFIREVYLPLTFRKVSE